MMKVLENGHGCEMMVPGCSLPKRLPLLWLVEQKDMTSHFLHQSQSLLAIISEEFLQSSSIRFVVSGIGIYAKCKNGSLFFMFTYSIAGRRNLRHFVFLSR